ncbi:MAG: DNA repair protein RecN [Thermodesulfovibrionales bacterium]|jgi:DNA repair protein RecN (Recombination protein N)
MLRELRVRDFTIVDDLTVSFSSGLNVLTGETGAGKSIIVDAIGLILGDKASQELIRTGKGEARIEASFDQADLPLLSELSIETDEGIIIRRTVSSQGKGRAYINDSPVSLQTLSRIGKSLVHIHGQHEYQDLLRRETHFFFVDAFGGLEQDLAFLRSLFREVAALRDDLESLKARMREREQRMDFLSFQVREITAAALRDDEKEELESERSILLNLSRLREATETAYDLLYGSESSCLDNLSKALSRIKEMAQIDHDAGEVLEAVEAVLPQVEEAASGLRRFRDKYETEPGRIDEVEERLELIRGLEKKYGGSISEVIAYRQKAEEELKGLELVGEQMADAESALAAKERALMGRAELISEKRRAAADEMALLIMGELRELGFQKAVFSIEIKRRETVSADGIDELEFLFSANPGEPPRPLVKVASGGELSRIMLALKCVSLKGQGSRVKGQEDEEQGHEESEVLTGPRIPDPGPFSLAPSTLVFDEVDAGIGGVAASSVGKRLKEISGHYQVFCITHLPQIASLADRHLKVEKGLDRERVQVSVSALEGEERMKELARMLSGRVTEASLIHARELLELTKEGI